MGYLQACKKGAVLSTFKNLNDFVSLSTELASLQIAFFWRFASNRKKSLASSLTEGFHRFKYRACKLVLLAPPYGGYTSAALFGAAAGGAAPSGVF
jgi:hypothetical protein